MNSLWFLLTLTLDIVPFVILSIFLLKTHLPCSIPVGIVKMVTPIMAYNVLICVTYMNGLYNNQVMVGLRIVALLLVWIIMCLTYKKFYLQFAYKCLFTLPYMLGVLQISAICLNYMNINELPDFMAITCLRLLFYAILAYPYYVVEKKLLISNFEFENKRVWIAFAISQLILDFAMIMTIRTDYAKHGIEPKVFLLQMVMTMASMSVTIIMYHGFKMSRDIELAKEKQMRDELLLELNSKQYREIQNNIEQVRMIKHDIRHHIRVLRQFLEEEKYDEVKKYLKEYEPGIPGDRIRFCENLSINALLSYYYNVANEKGIEVDFDLAALADSRFDDIDMNILLGNAIENAIEACMRVKEGKCVIKACAKRVARQIFITIDNQFENVVNNKEGKALSGKRNYQTTGYGNASMDAVVAKYHGQIKREVKGDKYLVSIVLMDAEET